MLAADWHDCRPPDGAELLRNFALDIAGCKGEWTRRAFRVRTIGDVRRQVGTGRVICGLSGGVDPSVVAVPLPVRTVGVMGDGRTYDQACALRAVTSTDGMREQGPEFKPLLAPYRKLA